MTRDRLELKEQRQKKRYDKWEKKYISDIKARYRSIKPKVKKDQIAKRKIRRV